MVVAIPLCLVKTYTHISYVSIFGILCACIGGFMLIGFCGNLMALGQAPIGVIKLFDISQFFGYIGIAMFSFEGNGIVINLKAAARNKTRFPNLLRGALLTIIIWYMLLGSLSYATYKQDT
jgi:amino acid permease